MKGQFLRLHLFDGGNKTRLFTTFKDSNSSLIPDGTGGNCLSGQMLFYVNPGLLHSGNGIRCKLIWIITSPRDQLTQMPCLPPADAFLDLNSHGAGTHLEYQFQWFQHGDDRNILLAAWTNQLGFTLFGRKGAHSNGSVQIEDMITYQCPQAKTWPMMRLQGRS